MRLIRYGLLACLSSAVGIAGERSVVRAGPERRGPEVEAKADPAPAFQLKDVRKVAVITFTTTGGNSDDFWTSLFMEQFRKRRPDYGIVDPIEVANQYTAPMPFNSKADIQPLIAAARRTGAECILLGNGHEYSVGWRLETKLVEVNEGKVLWSAASASGLTLTGPRAKKKAVHKVLSDYPKPPR